MELESSLVESENQSPNRKKRDSNKLAKRLLTIIIIGVLVVQLSRKKRDSNILAKRLLTVIFIGFLVVPLLELYRKLTGVTLDFGMSAIFGRTLDLLWLVTLILTSIGLWVGLLYVIQKRGGKIKRYRLWLAIIVCVQAVPGILVWSTGFGVRQMITAYSFSTIIQLVPAYLSLKKVVKNDNQ